MIRTVARRPAGRLTALFVLLSLAPLALLTYFSLHLSTRAVSGEVKARISSTAMLSAEVVQGELGGLGDVVQSYAGRPHLIAALRGDLRDPETRTQIHRHLLELKGADTGISTTFLAGLDGKLIDIVPATPEIVGKDFSFRDWYKGVTRSGGVYVSSAYRTQARGRPLVVAVATLVRDKKGKPIAILVAAYGLAHLQDFTERIAAAQHVELEVTDQRGVLIAEPESQLTHLVSRRTNETVAAALRGQSGVVNINSDGNRLAAYTPIRHLGWTVTASVPANTALAAVGHLRSTVLTIAAILTLVLLGGLVILLRTLRGRRRAEDDARRLADINRAVLDATPDGICLIEPDGGLTVANQAIKKIAELHGLEAEGDVRELAAVVRDRTTDPQAYWDSMQEILADPELESVFDYDLVDGRSFRRYTAPVRTSDGRIMGRIMSISDTTAEREAERLKSELVATVSHELRTPLASIVGFAELLVDREVDDDTRKRYLATIHSEARRLTNLVNDFLDLQRLEEGGFTLALEPVELGIVLREQADLFRGQSTSHEIDVVAPEEPVRVLGERDRIAQVAGNLISNAIKYSPGGGRVEVRAEPRGAAVRISVSDEGLGIPADQQRLLFTKFFRVDTSDTREIGGTGLGLALCREIVEAHGGRIGFDSVEGQGSTFWFELPTSQRGNGDRSGRRRVLVIEDDPAASSLLAEYIGGGNGFDVEIAATGEQGLTRAIEDPPGLICLDIRLPGDLDGWDVLARLRERADTAEIPVVVCTGRNGRDKASALGATDFITKPFSQLRIREAVARLLPEGRGAVLVVDDDPAVRRLVIETLRPEGVELREAADGEAALAEIAARQPDVVILDLIMPGLDGFAVLERLQDEPETKLLPVIVLTARRLSADERAMLRDRAVSLLEKSAYSGDELRRIVHRALG